MLRTELETVTQPAHRDTFSPIRNAPVSLCRILSCSVYVNDFHLADSFVYYIVSSRAHKLTTIPSAARDSNDVCILSLVILNIAAL